MRMTKTVPRHAASLIIVRQDAAGMQVLMGHRSAGHRFMPNALVFPGGAVDPADFAAPVAAPLRAEVAARLQRAASPELAHALGVAACRELTEEVGLSLGDPPRLDQLSYLCRAITPADHPIRFNARFFVVSASALTGTPVASRELEAPTWYDIEAALVAGAVFVTQAVLMRLRQWVATPGAADWAVPVLRERAWTDE
jgi:8-oxo-dGTP pyrophosphatase MutT (NUDIX family)